MADKLADKKLGEELALGSQVEVGQFTNKQQVNGKLIYVAPEENEKVWDSLTDEEKAKILEGIE